VNSLLFADYVRRHRWVLASLGMITATGWFMALIDSAAFVQGAMAVSIAVATMAGLFATKDLAPMEVQVLPISRREISRTLWWVSTVLTVGIMTTGKVIGWAIAAFGPPVAVGPETIWLSAAMDFVSTGTILCWMPLVQLVSTSISSYRWQTVATLAITFPVLAAPFVPFFLRDHMPLAWGGLGPVSAALIATGALCTALAYVVRPQLMIGGNRHAIAGAMASQRRSGFWLQLDRLTGLRRMAFQVWRTATTSQVLTPVLIALTAQATAGLFEGPSSTWEAAGWPGSLREFGFMPFEAVWEPARILMLFMLGSFAFRMEPGMTGTGVLTSMRHLRTLPLTTRRLNSLLLGLSLMVWVNGWLILACYHWLVTGQPLASFRLAVFLGLFGLDCLNKAAQLRYGTKGLINIPAFMVLGFILLTAVRTGLPLEPTFLTLGAAGLVGAWFVNQHTLTTRRKIYTPQRYRPFGMEIPGQS